MSGDEQGDAGVYVGGAKAPYVRVAVPGLPNTSQWIPLGEPVPAGLQHVDQGPLDVPAWAHWALVVGAWLAAAAILIMGAIALGQYVSDEYEPWPATQVVTPAPHPYPEGWTPR